LPSASSAFGDVGAICIFEEEAREKKYIYIYIYIKINLFDNL